MKSKTRNTIRRKVFGFWKSKYRSTDASARVMSR
jgi:hypothetical protein